MLHEPTHSGWESLAADRRRPSARCLKVGKAKRIVNGSSLIHCSPAANHGKKLLNCDSRPKREGVVLSGRGGISSSMSIELEIHLGSDQAPSLIHSDEPVVTI